MTTLLLKVNYGGLNKEDIEHQLYVMNHLRTSVNHERPRNDRMLAEGEVKIGKAWQNMQIWFVGHPRSEVAALPTQGRWDFRQTTHTLLLLAP